MRSIICVLIAAALVVQFSSCTSYKKIPYFKNIDEYSQEELLSSYGIYEARIKPNDILSITVNSNIPGAAVDFNLPVVPANYDKIMQTTVAVSTTGSGTLQNYLVSKDGFITFPVLGDLRIVGMTTEELQNHITKEIYPRYISEKPVVTVRMLNFKVSVLGEVNRPGVYESENAQMTVLDALAAAGDMTIYGKRESVLLLRTDDQGVIIAHRLNLQDKNIISDKDFFYMQQNDKLYVETNKAKGNNSTFGTAQTIGLSALSILISIVAILTR